VKIRLIRVIRVPGSNQIIKTKNNRQDLQDGQDIIFFENPVNPVHPV
jgi:hypothetical protein